MTNLRQLLISALVVLGPSSMARSARADEPMVPDESMESAEASLPPEGDAVPATTPELPPPEMMPLPPPEPATAVVASQPIQQMSAPVAVREGQWTYTTQYGWIWTPYDQGYTQVYPDAAIAYTFAYYPAAGWRWLSAPWILGFGPRPYWGSMGMGRFAWYSHPWFRVGTPFRNFRGGYSGGPRGYGGPSYGWGHPVGGGHLGGGHAVGGGRPFGGDHSFGGGHSSGGGHPSSGVRGWGGGHSFGGGHSGGGHGRH